MSDQINNMADYRARMAGRPTISEAIRSGGKPTNQCEHGNLKRQCLICELQDELAAVTKERDEARRLLEMSRCPNCDGSGAIPWGDPDDPGWEQCRWCYEREQHLAAAKEEEGG